MIKTLPIAITAGLSSALLLIVLVAIASNVGFLAYLLLFVPLPLFVAGLGWGHKTAAISGTVAALTLYFIVSPEMAIPYFLTIALPATLLTYFALMSREGEKNGVEWYPLGRLVVICASFLTGLALLTVFIAGGSLDDIYKAMEKALTMTEAGRTALNEIEKVDPETAKAVKQFAVKFAPAAGAALSMLSLLTNMYLAQKLLAIGGKAIRTELSLDTMTYPKTYLICFAASLVLTFLGGIPGFIAGIFAAIGIMAYALIGFITIHKMTAGNPMQIFILVMVYFGVILLQWLALIVVMGIGLYDSFFGLRNKFNKNNGT